MVLKYTSHFNHQKLLVVQWFYSDEFLNTYFPATIRIDWWLWLHSDGSQVHVSMQPSESSGGCGGGSIAMVLKYISPFNHQNRLVVLVV